MLKTKIEEHHMMSLTLMKSETSWNEEKHFTHKNEPNIINETQYENAYYSQRDIIRSLVIVLFI